MTFLDNIRTSLGYEVGIYDLNGKLIDGQNIGFVWVNDFMVRNGKTFIPCHEHIIILGGELSKDACKLVQSTYCMVYKNKAFEKNSLEYIIKNDVSPELIKGKYLNHKVLYITSRGDILDILKSIYEDEPVEFVVEEDGIYLVKLFEDPHQESEAIINGIWQEKGIKTVIGCGRTINSDYTIKDAAKHAKTSCQIALNLHFADGFFDIDKMLIYGLLSSIENDDIEYFLKGSQEGFTLAAMDKELVDTAEQLFRCNLNISETSRNLYIHRNTLLYRIEKIRNLTGLDIKVFEDALNFKVIISILKLKNTLKFKI